MTFDSLYVAFIIGSSTWDILADNVGQGELCLDHRLAMWNLIDKMKSMFPHSTLLCKSPTPVHAHIVIDKSTKRLGKLLIQTFFRLTFVKFICYQAALNRTKYMSSRRTDDLYKFQRGKFEKWI